MQTLTKTLTTKRANASKLVLGFVGIAATTIIGTAGIAAAQTKEPNMPNPSSKAACADFAQFGFKNHGQCVSWWEQHNNPGKGNGGGSGYGGSNNTVNSNLNLNVKGNNNVISIVINYFFG